ncbi:MAG: SdrD B-like domain-containing protein [Gemmataceae bacterium]
MNWIDTVFQRWNRTRKKSSSERRRPFRPRVEMLETREVPALMNFLQGFAFIDANANGLFDTGEAPKVGAQIRLVQPEGPDRIAVTDANGYYRFSNLNTGVYTLAELTPPEYTASGVQAIPLVSSATVLTASSVQVTLGGDSGSLAWNRTPNVSVASPSAYVLDGGPLNPYTSQLSSSNAHQYQGFLSSNGAAITPAFLTYCVDLFHANPSSFGVTLSSSPYLPAGSSLAPTTADNLGRIAYLYNTYGRTPFTGPTASASEAGLGLALYELIYDSTPNLAAGNFRVQMAANDPVVLAANNYLAESAGKNQSAVFLNVNTPPDASPAFSNSQGMLATELFNFANRTVTSPPTTPGISLVKTADKANYAPGESVSYRYVVTNTGGTTLTGVVVKDDNATPTYPGDDFTVGTVASLAPGARPRSP